MAGKRLSAPTITSVLEAGFSPLHSRPWFGLIVQEFLGHEDFLKPAAQTWRLTGYRQRISCPVAGFAESAISARQG